MKENVFSFFKAPISNTVPDGVVNVKQLHEYITHDERLMQCTRHVRKFLNDEKKFRSAKTLQLPFVTPGGVFLVRRMEGLYVPSGLLVVDIDHLSSAQEAERLRDRLADDRIFHPTLTFVSPSRLGVKVFLPVRYRSSQSIIDSYSEAMQQAAHYLKVQYDIAIDPSGKDICRSCFVCHDAGARLVID